MNETNSKQDFKILFGERFLGLATPIIILIGLVLNPLSFYIYSKPAFDKAPAVVYLKALCVLDTLVVIQIIQFVTDSFAYEPTLLHVFFCKSFWFWIFFRCASSASLEAFISLDRCLSVEFVNRF